MTAYRKTLPERPSRVKMLPISDKGYPVPWFVQWFDGVPDFRVVDPHKMRRAIYHKQCWVCGEPLGRYMTFVGGPLSVVTRASGEPPSHHECATYAARACPFMVLPLAQRREATLPEATVMKEGHLDRNPGVAMLWTTTGYSLTQSPTRGDVIIIMGEPMKVEWFARGRIATREEVVSSLQEGMPHIEAVAAEDGLGALDELAAKVATAQRWLPSDEG
jgi:hypothetical protein